MSRAKIGELFAKHCQETITPGEWRELQELLLAEGHRYGDMLSDYPCPNTKCAKPLLFSWYNGPVCWHATGGCGWHFPAVSQYALHESR